MLIDKHHDALFRQFVKAEKKPSFDLYVSEHYTDIELQNNLNEIHKRIPSIENTDQLVAANFVTTTAFETHINDLHSEFYSLVVKNELPQKYYCNDIIKTDIIKVFLKVDSILDILKMSVTLDNYDIYKEAEIRAKSISIATRDIEKSLANNLLRLLIEDDNNVGLYANILCSKDSSNKGYIFDMWRAFKDNFNLKLEEILLETAKDVSLAARYNIQDYKQFLERKEKEDDFSVAVDDNGKHQRQPKSQQRNLTINKIALYHAYENIQVTRENANDIVQQYGHTSGEKLFQRFTYFSSTTNRKGKPNPCTHKRLQNKIDLINGIIPLLSECNKQRATDEVNILKSHLETEFQ